MGGGVGWGGGQGTRTISTAMFYFGEVVPITEADISPRNKSQKVFCCLRFGANVIAKLCLAVLKKLNKHEFVSFLGVRHVVGSQFFIVLFFMEDCTLLAKGNG